jgi:hypothetical protein
MSDAIAADDLESILVILEGAAAADNVEEKISALARLTVRCIQYAERSGGRATRVRRACGV